MGLRLIIRQPTFSENVAQISPSDRERIAALLVTLQTAESAGAAALARWAARCQEPSLKAVLLVVSARDVEHAALASARRAQLSSTAHDDVGIGRALSGLCMALASDEVSDRAKLSMLLARFPSQSHDLFAAELAAVQGDDETRAMLDVIGDDERVSLRWLRMVQEAAPELATESQTPRPELLAFLDDFAAAECGAAAVYEAWAAVCRAPSLRGALRVLARREATHGQLASQRLRDVGSTSHATLDGALWRTAVAHAGRADIPDRDKIQPLLARYPTDESAGVWLLDQAHRCDEDPLTRTQLEIIAATEVATIAWLRRYAAAL